MYIYLFIYYSFFIIFIIKFILIDELEAPVTLEDFNIAISKIQRSVSQADIKKFDQWMEEYGAN